MVVVSGRTDVDQMCYILTFSLAAIGDQLQNIGHTLREWEANDRTGFLLPFKIETAEDLSSCDWGRQPKGKGKGGGTGGHGGPSLGQQQQAGATGGLQLGGAQLGQGGTLGGNQLGQGGAIGGPQLGQGGAAGGSQQGQGGAIGGNQLGQSGAIGGNHLGQGGAIGGGAQVPTVGGASSVGIDPWRGQTLGKIPGGGTEWGNYTPSQPGSSASASASVMQGGTSPVNSLTYANTPVTAIGDSLSVSYPGGVGPPQPLAR